MITITATKRYGATTLRVRVSAPTIERALELAGPGARVEFPIDGEAFFAATTREGIDYASMSQEEIEAAYEAGLPGSYDAYLDMLKDDLGADGFEQYGLENCLI
ncbi:MAG: hypothetical protein M3522_05965 [Actinomycetota bacterium]|nr:hypothetical protein [Actinomycetota bacterium]